MSIKLLQSVTDKQKNSNMKTQEKQVEEIASRKKNYEKELVVLTVSIENLETGLTD